jgi:hypothetical protein
MPLKPKTPEVLKRSKDAESEEPATEVLNTATVAPPGPAESGERGESAAEPPAAQPKRKPKSAEAKPKASSARKPAKTEPKPPRPALIPRVKLGHIAANGVSPALYVLIERGAAKRPKVASSLTGTVEVRFTEDFAAVRMVFDSNGALIEDDDGRAAGWEPDLLIEGSLSDIVQLAAAPLVGGMPKLTDKRGRAAIARVADRRVRIDGSPLVARRLLKLLEI